MALASGIHRPWRGDAPLDMPASMDVTPSESGRRWFCQRNHGYAGLFDRARYAWGIGVFAGICAARVPGAIWAIIGGQLILYSFLAIRSHLAMVNQVVVRVSCVSDPNITRLLHDWVQGDQRSLEALTPLVYDQLHRIASRAFRSERPDHTLQTTALVHEAFAKLIDVDVEWQDRSHFFALAARMMRRILVDHANARAAAKRGGSAAKLPLDDVVVVSPEASSEVLDLHEALNALAEQDGPKAEMLELHYFGGLTYDEMSQVLDRSTSSLDRDIRFAKAWLRTHLESQDE